jgi:hypothetical protein
MAGRTPSSAVEQQEIEALEEAKQRSPDLDPSLAIFSRDVDAYDEHGGTANSEDATVQDWAVAEGLRPDMPDETDDGLDVYEEPTRHAAEDPYADDTLQERIRRKAYEMWESEGGIHGRAEDHWHLAAQLVAEEDAQRSSLLPFDPGGDSPVEEAFILDNLGEFPALADQGNQLTESGLPKPDPKNRD